MKITKYNNKFDSFHLGNRWKEPIYRRSGSWTYFGFSKRFFSPSEFEYTIHLFGFDFRFWFIRSVKKI